MTKDAIFEAWVPPTAIWSRWAKPVLFSQLESIAAAELVTFGPPGRVGWVGDTDHETALVLDLPGALGVTVGLSLAASGYRPVPLYNAVPEPSGDTALVDVRPIMIALASAAPLLQGIALPTDAPPAFLLDYERNPAIDVLLQGEFDNRSISLPTDFPSAELLRSHGVRRIVLVQPRHAEPHADLAHSLRGWQAAGLPICTVAVDDPETPRPIHIQPPNLFRELYYNLLAFLGLKSAPLGGFGGRLPMPSNG